MLQDIWKQRTGWDEPLNAEFVQRWKEFELGFRHISEIRTPRWLGTDVDTVCEFHGFADVSQSAYGAALYLRMTTKDGQRFSRLLTAKTRVAPVKTITVPRLELCAAALLVRLIKRIPKTLSDRVTKSHAWSDSRTVLAWLSSEPSRWTTFVANRVSEIQTKGPFLTWNYVPSRENPADIASRGMNPDNLTNASQWWHGPSWLSKPSSMWPLAADDLSARSETRASEEARIPKAHCLHVAVEDTFLNRFSSLTRLVRVVARCLRFRKSFDPETRYSTTYLTSHELADAFIRCVRLVQSVSFQDEIRRLQRSETLPKRSRLTQLNPFLDHDGTLRVGGRLQAAALPYGERHPPILLADCHLSHLIIDWAHKTALHGGMALTYSLIARRVWMLNARRKVRAFIQQCLPCLRSRERTSVQLMGSLPGPRVSVTHPFTKVWIDYAGPLQVKTTRGRGIRCIKGYLALFVCLSSKAVHLEVVGDLTTNSFISALHRFTSRRGTPAEISSDNATTFRGADAELRNMLREAEIQWDLVADSLANEGISWKFIPPSAPHFGGLWEAAVKSAKSYLKRVVGQRPLTFEELTTLFAQIEFCMNSRPLIPLSGLPEDVEVFTPWHLITGRAPRQIPEPIHLDPDINHLSHWRLLQAMRDHFWCRWSREYLHTIQQRSKWTQPAANYQVGDIVLIIDPSLLRHRRWPMGRILDAHTGRDGLVRVVKVRTADRTYVRPISKLCQIPTK